MTEIYCVTKKTPECIGIILDGNRRWAKENKLSSVEGHKRGAEKLKDVACWVRDRGIKHLAVYAFSTENWNRSEEEVNYLLKLFHSAIDKLFRELSKENITMKFAGERESLDPNTQAAMSCIEEASEKNTGLTLWVCFSYGGRAEILRAATKSVKEGSLSEEMIAKNLWTAGMPEPDIIIRTGGEKRLSGFLTWQSVYSELFFVDEYWPDFSEKILDSILKEYGTRTRRMGK